MAHDPTTDLYPVFKAMGSLPFGEKGRLEYERLIKTAGPIIDKAKIIASKNQLPAIVKDIAIADLTVSVNFSEIREDGLYAVGFGKLTPARLLSGWIRHVFLNICAPTDYPKETILIGQDPKGKVPFLKCIFPALGSEAKAVAEQLTLLFQSGHTSPLYFFCNTSFQFANALSRHGYALTTETVSEAMHKSRSSWYGGYFITGEKENRYVSLYVEKNDPFESVENSLKSGFARNAVCIYKPLLENLKIIS